MKHKLETFLSINALAHDVVNKAKAALSGIEGESEFARWLENYGDFGDCVMHNLYLEDESLCQIDCMYITEDRIYVFEIKNHRGDIEIHDHKILINGESKHNHPFDQVRRARNIAQNIAAKIDPRLEVVSVLIYINEHANVNYVGSYRAEDNTSDNFLIPQIVTRCQLRNYIWTLCRKTEFSRYNTDRIESIKQQIMNYSSPKQYFNITFGNLQLDQIQGNLLCPNCKSPNLTISHKTGECRSCGRSYKKLELLIFAINVYWWVYKKEIFTPKEIYEFINGKLSYKYICKIVPKYYNLHGDAKRKHYRYQAYTLKNQ